MALDQAQTRRFTRVRSSPGIRSASDAADRGADEPRGAGDDAEDLAYAMESGRHSLRSRKGAAHALKPPSAKVCAT